MVGIKIRQKWLELFPGTVLSFELNTPAYLGDDVDVIQGAFSFPADIPLSPANQKLLNFPDRLDNSSLFVKDEPAEVWTEGEMLFPALATISEAGPGRAKMTLLVSSIAKLKEFPLNELDFGGMVTMGSTLPAVLSYAKDTALHPENYDHIFFPVHNPGFLDDSDADTGVNPGDFQNFWNHDEQVFYHRPNDVVTPFLKLQFVLEKIFSTNGFSLKNNWMSNEELRLLTVYNNYNISSLDTGAWPLNFDPKNHVSKSKAGDFLKNLARLFNLGVFVNYFDKTAEIFPLEEAVKSDPRVDWTKKALSDFTVSQSLNYPSWFSYPSIYPELAYFNNEQPLLEKGWPSELFTVDKMENLTPADPAGIYLETSSNFFYQFYPTPSLYWGNRGAFMPTIFNSTNFHFISGIGAVWMGDSFNRVPQVRVKGTTAAQRNDCPDRLMFYRKMQKNWENKDYPMGDAMGFTAAKEIIQLNGMPVQYSLYWDTERGIFNRFWKNWYTMLKQKRDVSLKLALTIIDLRNFNFKHKIRIGNQNYFVKKLRITLTARGLELTDAELVTTV